MDFILEDVLKQTNNILNSTLLFDGEEKHYEPDQSDKKENQRQKQGESSSSQQQEQENEQRQLHQPKRKKKLLLEEDRIFRDAEKHPMLSPCDDKCRSRCKQRLPEEGFYKYPDGK